MTCAEQFRVMAFAQLRWRENLRDIEVTLNANANKLYSMGLRHAIHRSTPADASESRDWRIWSDLAAVLIRRALRESLASRVVLQMDKAAPAHQEIPRHQRERRKDAKPDTTDAGA
jgi:hypothetical protein